ncbi:MAG: hypothetical protein ACKV2V_01235 [Blastocatellia bacterium]
MSYREFTLPELQRRFSLVIAEEEDLFGGEEEIVPSTLLSETLAENTPLALAINTEKARSELIVMPVLMELRRQVNRQISLFSGIEFDVDSTRGLSGFCDFIISRSTQQLVLCAPIITLVEAKNDNIKSGLAQCIGEMMAAKIFNERENNPLPAVHGVVTTGSIWKFLRLTANQVRIDQTEYYLESVGRILAILKRIVLETPLSERN